MTAPTLTLNTQTSQDHKIELIKWIAVYLIDRRDVAFGMHDNPYWEGAEDMAAALLSTLIGEAMCDVKEIINITADTRYEDVVYRLKQHLSKPKGT